MKKTDISKVMSLMGKKGAETTNKKYTPEQRKQWAKKGGWPKGKPRKVSTAKTQVKHNIDLKTSSI